jgi:hypothetical protein
VLAKERNPNDFNQDMHPTRQLYSRCQSDEKRDEERGKRPSRKKSRSLISGWESTVILSRAHVSTAGSPHTELPPAFSESRCGRVPSNWGYAAGIDLMDQSDGSMRFSRIGKTSLAIPYSI